jgi:anti-sigma factor RsiW
MTAAPQLSLDRAREILAAYGANPARWPTGERDALSALIAAQPELAQAVAQAQALDQALEAWPQTHGQAEAIDRLMARAAVDTSSRSERPRWLWVGAGLSAAIAAGLAVAFVSGPSLSPPIAPTVATQASANGLSSISDADVAAMLFSPQDQDEEWM